MGIGSITSTNSMSGMQMTMTGSTESRNKSIQKEITDAQQQMRSLSSDEELSVSEQENERKTLRKKITSLNTELKQHQEEFRKSQKREIMLADLQEETKLKKDGAPEAGNRAEGTASDKDASRLQTEDNKKTGIGQDETKPSDRMKDAEKEQSHGKDTKAPSSFTAAQQQNDLQGTVITRTGDGIVILKEDTKQDKAGGLESGPKQTEESFLQQTTGQTSPIENLQTKENKDTDSSETEAESLEDDMDSDRGLSQQEIYGIVSADASVQQADSQATVIARIEGGIAILKGEMKQEELRGIESDPKQAELEKMEQREERARIFQSYVLGDAGDAMKSAAADKTSDGTGSSTNNSTFARAFQLSQEAQASQQSFYVSIDN